MITRLVSVALILLLAACGQRPQAAPSSRLTSDDAFYAAFKAAYLLTETTQRRHEAGTISDTGSMVPTLDDNAFTVVEYGVAASDIRVGDIVIFWPPWHTGPVCHRVVGINARGLVTRGDANRSDDPGHITDRELMGRVVAIFFGSVSD